MLNAAAGLAVHKGEDSQKASTCEMVGKAAIARAGGKALAARIRRAVLAALLALIVGLATFACGGASGGYDYDSAEGHRRSDIMDEPRLTPLSKQCIDYANAREVRADERAGKLTKTDKRWLDVDRDGRFCEEPDAEWKGEPVRPE